MDILKIAGITIALIILAIVIGLILWKCCLEKKEEKKKFYNVREPRVVYWNAYLNKDEKNEISTQIEQPNVNTIQPMTQEEYNRKKKEIDEEFEQKRIERERVSELRDEQYKKEKEEREKESELRDEERKKRYQEEDEKFRLEQIERDQELEKSWNNVTNSFCKVIGIDRSELLESRRGSRDSGCGE